MTLAFVQYMIMKVMIFCEIGMKSRARRGVRFAIEATMSDPN